MYVGWAKLQLLVSVSAVVAELTRCMRRVRVTTHYVYLSMVRPVEVGKLRMRTLVVLSSFAHQPTDKVFVARVADGKKDCHVAMLCRRNAQLACIPDPLFAKRRFRVIGESLNRERATFLLGAFAGTAQHGCICTQIILGHEPSGTLSLENAKQLAEAAVAIDHVLAAEQRHSTQ